MAALMDVSMDVEEMRDIQSTIAAMKKKEKERREIEQMEVEFKQKYGICHNMGLEDVFQHGRNVVIYVNGKMDQYIYMRTDDLLRSLMTFSEERDERSIVNELRTLVKWFLENVRRENFQGEVPSEYVHLHTDVADRSKKENGIVDVGEGARKDTKEKNLAL